MSWSVTNLGDPALLIPASALLLAYLVLARLWWAATAWMTALALCVALTILAKIVFGLCGAQFSIADIQSPSGHTSLSATFYGCAALMISAAERQRTQLILFITSMLLVVAIGITRVLLHAHTPEEVFLGFAIGLCCVAWFAFRFMRHAAAPLSWRSFAFAAVALVILTHGRHLGIETLIAHLEDEFHVAGYTCIYPARLVRLDTIVPRRSTFGSSGIAETAEW